MPTQHFRTNLNDLVECAIMKINTLQAVLLVLDTVDMCQRQHYVVEYLL
jgi:hypothetical protein